MMNDTTGKTQRVREKQKTAGENTNVAEESLFPELILSFTVYFPSNPRSELRGNEEEEEEEL